MKIVELNGGVSLWKGAQNGNPPLVIAPAMGVSVNFYFDIAEFFSTEFDPLIVEYSGMSMPTKTDANLDRWAEDLGRTIDYAGSHRPCALLTHSVGGQIFGLLPGCNVDRVVMVASQSGYWKNWDGLSKLGMFAFWYGFVPVTTGLLKKIPMSTFNAGEDIPRFVGQQWAEFGRDPNYIMGHAKRTGRDNFKAFSGRLKSVGFTDDSYAPKRAVEALFLAYENASKNIQFVAPSDIGRDAIGHFSAFRDTDHNRSLWEDWRAFLG